MDKTATDDQINEVAEYIRDLGLRAKLLPGSTRTAGVQKFIQDVFPGMDYEAAEKRFMAENRPTSLIGRLILPEEVAALVAFVCSPLSSAINGACLRVDGGLIRSAV